MKKGMVVLVAGLIAFTASISFGKLDSEEQTKVNALVETLALDSDQTAQLTQERETSKKELLRLEKKWQTLHDQLRREVRKRKVNAKKIDEISQAIGKIRGEIVALRTHSLIYLKSILNDEQLKKIETDQPSKISVDQD